MMGRKTMLKTHSATDYTDKAQQRAAERGETERVRAAARAIGDVVYKHTQNRQKLQKEFAHITHKSTVSCEQIVDALKLIGHPFDLEAVQRTVSYLLPNTDLEAVEYVEFLQALVT